MAIYLGRQSFEAQEDPSVARRMFKRNVTRVEVETHSYCNRRCSYCPNVVGDRLGPNERLPARLYDMVTRDLGTIDYDRLLILQGYNEPLYDRAILDRIAEARERVPACKIAVFTNGDYLTPEYLEELADAGLDYMHVSIHLKIGDVYNDRYVLGRVSEIAHRIGIRAKIAKLDRGLAIKGVFPHDRLGIMVRAENYWRMGNTRGNLIDGIDAPEVRTSPCLVPFTNFYVGFSGNIVPCCHLRSDRAEHAPYLIGNLGDFDSIFAAYAGTAAAGWRRSLIHTGPKAAPCDRCTADLMTDPAKLAVCEEAHSRLRAEEPMEPTG